MQIWVTRSVNVHVRHQNVEKCDLGHFGRDRTVCAGRNSPERLTRNGVKSPKHPVNQ